MEELFGVRDKSVVITGGSRGIGEAIAEIFVKAGARVYICARRAEEVNATAARLSEFGHCKGLSADLSAEAGRKAFIADLSQHESSLDVLINNAGTIWAAPLAEYPESGWDKVFDLNVKGLFFFIRDLVPMLAKAGRHGAPARVINVGSIDAFHVPKHETYAYSSSKAAVHHLSAHLAAQLAPQHITVNVIAPGLFPSKMLANSLETKGEEVLIEPVPLKRLTGPNDMAGAAIYLASAASAYVTAAMIPVDGGLATTL
ncbi:SDR family oxidoreductase [Brucella haematophila]|uniref:SDR family oxidoreductase n=1 Tax=Brucella haematophila TaxID=419474 RepID=A0ABX1DUM8_9HYPH|nr:SDR family oxidoreductase [Brucella haematophila]TMV04737.1 SDR family oxidoreductase [Brucella haematophila]